jgi:peptidyl-dipeptidase Dcp
MGWWLFWKVKTKLFDFDDEKLKPYFQLEKYWTVLLIAQKLYEHLPFDIDKE